MSSKTSPDREPNVPEWIKEREGWRVKKKADEEAAKKQAEEEAG